MSTKPIDVLILFWGVMGIAYIIVSLLSHTDSTVGWIWFSTALILKKVGDSNVH